MTQGGLFCALRRGAAARVRLPVGSGAWRVWLLAALALAAAAIAASGKPPAIVVHAGDDLQAVLDAAPRGALVRLEPGRHPGPVALRRPVTLVGPPSAVVAAPRRAPAVLAVHAGEVRLEGFGVEGGETGIAVRSAEGVELVGLAVGGAAMEGIDVADAHAIIEDVAVGGLVSPLGQGIEIRNSEHRGTTVVRSSTVTGGQEGIVSHVSRVRFEDNVVRATTMHGISITEMSRGVASGNRVADASGAGFYCGDMSRCEFHGNRTEDVTAAAPTRSGAGWGLLVHYHSSASSTDDDFAGTAGATGVFDGSQLRDRSPLRLGEGWSGLVPALWIVPLALLALALASRAVRRVARPREERREIIRWATPLVLVGLAVQTFHMLEHGLQVYRVHFDGVPSRGGIIGPGIEAEWIHFAYNALVLTSLALVAQARRRGWGGAPRPRADALLGASLALQAYHVLEHAVKVVQHVASGAKVNPGLAGEFVDLVWFHFGVNLAVYAGFVGAAGLLLPPLLRPRAARRLLTGAPAAE